MKPAWKQVLLTVALLMLALAGCSSDSTTPQQAESAKDTFRKYSGYLQNVEFRQALRNSWVGTSENSASGFMAQNDQPDSIPITQGPVSGALLDVGKKIGGDLIKKGLSYGIDKAFGIQSKSQKLKNEENFINHTLLGIQHQLTTIRNTLTDVYNNQVEQMSDSSVQQLQVITDFSNAEKLIVEASTSQTAFENLYSAFIPAIEQTTSAPDWEVDFETLCTKSDGFISTYYNNLSTDGTDDQSTILADAYDVVNELFGTGALATSYVNTQATNATQYISNLIGTNTGKQPQPPATGINLLSNYYAAGTRVTQAAYGIADILQKSYMVMAFTLQLAVNSECAYNGMTVLDYLSKGDVYAVDVIYAGIDFSTLTSDTLPTALSKLASNFNQFVTQAQNDITTLANPFITYDGTTQEYWDPVAIISHAGLNLAGDFMQNGCFPISYIKSVNGNGNLDYLAAECNYNNYWTVIQLYIPTNNGTPGMTDISYLSGFGLIGDIDYQEISHFMSQPGTISSAGTCSSHYDNQCTCGFDDCHVGQASIKLQPTPEPSYGSAFMQGAPYLTPGLNQRFTIPTNLCQGSMSDHVCTNNWYVVVFTPNGHLFQADIQGQYCENETAHDMKNTQLNFGATGITEATQLNNSTLSFTDGNQVTNITFGGPCNNPAGQDGNANPNWAEYGFGVNVQSAPQPDTSSYSICANTSDTNTLINLNGFYSYSDGDAPYLGGGTITDAYSINVNGYSGTFDANYSTLTINAQTWTRATAKTTVDVGQNAMQGLWQSGTSGNTVYMTTNCSYPMISGTVSTDGDLYMGVTITLSSSSSGDTQSTTTDSLGNYVFMVKNGTYTVIPSSSGCTFSPTSQQVTVSTANVSDVDFTATCN